MHGIQTSEPKESYMKTLISTLILLGTVSSAFAESNSSPKYSDEKCKQLNDSCAYEAKEAFRVQMRYNLRDDEVALNAMQEAQDKANAACQDIIRAERSGRCD